ncbi:MAG: alpha-hydroxy-acid oxidizing protein [Lentisphaerae bacterium]|nr:alpha-hydroxy-acid oxidizing protein [Lentisphaerota bacterium]MBT4815881.1 alpha-hydroxy-acid oxidizing protein [Lentisphaerota bacterium]MBT5609072.1 alpha-hydroxy-acid oxidizing protein [Lentisphaerota bacterium]MBT7053833.1 alpha-hydroxy-acid oxidizing protein [Lentisphaerota bacterium]MBT7842470.1 alpha-hydroxy-acid oxidizing protein [Lentisphaerota bacterium]
MTLEDVRAEAKKKLKGICVVYKDCDGSPSNFCQGQHYGRALGLGGIGSGASFHNNWLALNKIELRMRLIGDSFEPDASFTFFGRQLTMPVMAAPVTGVNSFGGENVISEAEFNRAVVDGCNATGTLGWRGDTYTYSLDTPYGLGAIAAGRAGGVKIVKPRAQKDIIAFFHKAEQCGATAVGVDVDGCGSYMMNSHNQPVFRKTPAELRELVEATSLPMIVKGVMCAEDAIAAAEAGAAGIVVSNHGGRVLDHTPGSADVLPDITAALNGHDVMVLADGGIRTGYDVLKMLALGADAVLVGRDIVRAAVGAGSEGVRIQMECLRKDLCKAMLMTGCPTLGDIGPHVLAPDSARIPSR